ncbi:hypothetical protein IEQ34_019315 [Dendrobium chrysotoxum]|uniref:Uncharacterized protein n=1 Tax=Dendrobium chrysotoxum TaxID=161865 RepID=A0AAV7G736_DENCH|nr:hypothetical protein IEQ34_019315 [Dendrobium chrysotoxum]
MGYLIDVVKLIFSSLMYIIWDTTSIRLGHPSLIYVLCVAAVWLKALNLALVGGYPIDMIHMDKQEFREILISLSSPTIMQIIASRSCERFFEELYVAIINVAQEFFANGKEEVNNRCYVRGKWVSFDYVAVNMVYGLKDFEFEEYNTFINTLIYSDDILNVLYGPNNGASKLIFSPLIYIIWGTTSVGLRHPSLIYTLCVTAGVRENRMKNSFSLFKP